MSRNEEIIRVEFNAILPYVNRSQPLTDESIGYHIGRVLRDVDEEVFESFVELICGFITDPPKLEEALPVCEIVAGSEENDRRWRDS